MKSVFISKYLWLLVIFLGLNIPLAMIEGQIEERTLQRDTAKHAVRLSWTGEQDIFAGLLVIPYQEKIRVEPISGYQEKDKVRFKWVERRQYVLAEHLSINAYSKNQSLSKGIYSVPVYTADIAINGEFDMSLLNQLQQNKDIKLTQTPFISVGVKDSRGLVGVPSMEALGKKLEVTPGTKLDFYHSGFSAAINEALLKEKRLLFNGQIQLNGMETLSFIAASKDSRVSARSDWRHPEFTGSFLPVSRQISSEGYQAKWQTGLFSTNIASALDHCFDLNSCESIYQSVFGVKHIQPVDIYQQSLRSVKYGILVILVTFCIFALYEILSQSMSIHPISYLLTGAALAIFFLLLIALSEHLHFAFAYWIASFSCSGLIAYYVAAQSQSKAQGLYIMAVLNALYTILFFIIRSEDHALLSGSLLLFFLLAIIMVVTGKLDWYRVIKIQR